MYVIRLTGVSCNLKYFKVRESSLEMSLDILMQHLCGSSCCVRQYRSGFGHMIGHILLNPLKIVQNLKMLLTLLLSERFLLCLKCRHHSET